MSIILQNNSLKPNEYNFYHICVFKDKVVISKQYDLPFSEAKSLIEGIKNQYDFIAVGTLENIDLCLRYINECQNEGILFCDIEKEDIFKFPNTIFVNCTNNFKGC